MEVTYKLIYQPYYQPYQPGKPHAPTPLSAARTETMRLNKFLKKNREMAEKRKAKSATKCQTEERDERQLRRVIPKPKVTRRRKAKQPTEKWRNHLFKLEKRCALAIKKDHDRLREERQKRR